MDKKDTIREYYALVRGLGQLLNLFRLYKPDHPVFKQKVADVFAVVERLTLKEKVLTLSEAGEVFLINGEKIDARDGMVGRMVERFHSLKIGSMDLVSGLDLEEFVIFVRLLSQTDNLSGAADIKNYLDSKGSKHVVPRFASYRLVKEGEKVVKEDKAAIRPDVSPDVKGRFLQDLKSGSVDGHLKEEKQDYRFLAHDPEFLFEFICSLIGKDTGIEEIVKILWFVGDYLINEITTAKEEDSNRKVLVDLEDRLLYFSDKRGDKAVWRETVKKAFDEIAAALELKGLTVVYKKHKKELKTLADRINRKLATLPSGSRARVKTEEDLMKMGPDTSSPEAA